MRYQQLLERGQPVPVRGFVEGEPPELRDELLAYLELLLITEQPEEPITLTATEQALVDRVAERTGARIQQHLATIVPAQTFTALRKAANLTPATLARAVNLPVDVVGRIERGGVEVATIPARLIAHLAAALRQTESALRAALTTPSAAAAIRLHAQDGTVPPPETAVSFAEALGASTATDDQKAEWT